MTKLLSLVIPLFILMDFIGTIPVFVSLTEKYDVRKKIRVAVLASLLACLIVLVFALAGEQILRYFDISISALKVGGGLLLIYIAFEMIFSGQLGYENADRANIIVSPLAIPMLAGPGSMTFAMIAFLELQGASKLLIPFAILITFVIGTATLAASTIFNKIFGREFIRGLEKVTAILLAIIASEMIMSGIKLYFFT